MKIQSILLATTLFAGIAYLHADDLEQLADKIKADHDYVLTHPKTIDPESLRLQHDAEMVRDMRERAQEVDADHAAYNKHLQEWLQKNKDEAAAQRLAEAAAQQAKIEAREKALDEALTRSLIRANNSVADWNNSH